MDKPNSLIINAALTGVIPKRSDSPFVPLTPEEIVEDALACAGAGASIVHIHVRDELGQPTAAPDRYAGVIREIRKTRPDLIICASTSGRREPDLRNRSAVLDLTGDEKPDMASLTLGSMNFFRESSINSPETIQQLACTMRDRGIKPELELFEPGMIQYARYLEKKGMIQPPWYANIMLGSLGTSPAEPRSLVHMIRGLPETTVWSVAGIGRYQLDMNALAVVMGGHVRTGLEDNLHYDRARKVPATNVDLIRRAVRIAAEVEREIASCAQARTMLDLQR